MSVMSRRCWSICHTMKPITSPTSRIMNIRPRRLKRNGRARFATGPPGVVWLAGSRFAAISGLDMALRFCA